MLLIWSPEQLDIFFLFITWILQVSFSDGFAQLEAQQKVCQVWRGLVEGVQHEPDYVLPGGVTKAAVGHLLLAVDVHVGRIVVLVILRVHTLHKAVQKLVTGILGQAIHSFTLIGLKIRCIFPFLKWLQSTLDFSKFLWGLFFTS